MADPGASRWSGHPLVQLTFCRAREFVREPEALFWTFVFPILLTAGLGLAFRNKPQDRTPIGIAAGAGAPAITSALSGDARIATRTLDDSAAVRALRTGKIALLIEPDGASVRYRYDDTRPESRIARLLADDALQRARGRSDPVATVEVRIHEAGSRYIDFLLPGLLAMNLMGTGIWGIGFSIVDQRRKRLLKRLVATPMSRAHYLASFLLSRFLWLVLEVVVLVGFGVFVFGVPLRGTVGALLLLCGLAAFMFGGLGVLVAARPRTIEGASGLMNLAMLPMWVLSGVFFNSSNFPGAMQPFIKALPLTAAVDALRATMLEGTPLASLGLEVGIMAAWLALSFALALRIFRWQ